MSEHRLTAGLSVNTFRKGVLARFGHDLRLELQRFELELRDGTVRGRFDVRSLCVLGAVEHGRLVTTVPSASDKAEIARTAAEILAAAAHPEARFEGAIADGASPRWHVRGELTLAGRSAPLQAEVEVSSDELRCTIELAPSRWGIAPYKAMGGALRLEDRVRIELVVGRDAGVDLAQRSFSVASGPVPY